jgi:predicted dithiol-disulfide oxidoreductase (DUF899 family)
MHSGRRDLEEMLMSWQASFIRSFTNNKTRAMNYPKVVSRGQWLVARKALLAQEKEVTHQRDALNAARRRLPMVKIEKEYVFEGPQGPTSLLNLFEGRRQLIVYHFMFEPGDAPPGKSGEPYDEGCSGCSFIVDNIGHLSHLHARNTTLVLVSRAPLGKIEPFKARMGWKVPWYSSFGSEFNYDFHVTTDESMAPVEYNYQDKATLERKGETYHLSGEQSGVSVFLRDDEDRVFHTYSTYGRPGHSRRNLQLAGSDAIWPAGGMEDSPAGGRKRPRTNGFATTTNTASSRGIPIPVVHRIDHSWCREPDPVESVQYHEIQWHGRVCAALDIIIDSVLAIWVCKDSQTPGGVAVLWGEAAEIGVLSWKLALEYSGRFRC